MQDEQTGHVHPYQQQQRQHVQVATRLRQILKRMRQEVTVVERALAIDQSSNRLPVLGFHTLVQALIAGPWMIPFLSCSSEASKSFPL
jgi:hypothetical protein